MIRFCLFLIVMICIGLWSLKPSEDKSGYFFPDENPGIMLTLQSTASETAPRHHDKVPVLLPSIGDVITIKSELIVDRNNQLESSTEHCTLVVGSRLIVRKTDPRGQVLVDLIQVTSASTSSCVAGRYTMPVTSFFALQSRKGEG